MFGKKRKETDSCVVDINNSILVGPDPWDTDDFPTPWVTDIKNSHIGTYGAGFYDFIEFPIGNHIITVEACNGYHISLDLPEWFDPGKDSWPSIHVTNKYKVMSAINYIIDKINKVENTHYELEFNHWKNNLEDNENISLSTLENASKYIGELSSVLGLDPPNVFLNSNCHVASRNYKVVLKCNKNRPLWDKMERLHLVIQKNPDEFALTNKGKDILQKFLLKPIDMQGIPLGDDVNE